jgi:hypothetical protein
MAWEIVAMGDATYVAQVLNAAASITGSNYGLIASIAAVIGLLLMGLRVVLGGGKEFTPQEFLLGAVLFAAFFIPRTSVIVTDVGPDPISGIHNTHAIDNVPMGLAVVGSVVSALGVGFTELMEQTFGGATDERRMLSGGFGYHLERFSRLRHLGFSGQSDSGGYLERWRSNVRTYVSDCTVRAVTSGKKTSSDVYNDRDPVNGIAWDSPNFTTRLVNNDGAGELVTCRDGVRILREQASGVWEALQDMSGSGGGGGGEGAQQSTPTQFTNVAKSAEDLLGSVMVPAGEDMQRFIAAVSMIPILREAATSGPLTSTKTALLVTLEQAAQQRNVQWLLEESMFRRVLKPVVSFFEALVYALAPFVAFLLGLGKFGFRLAGKYLVLPLWVGMMHPLLAITDAHSIRKFEQFLENFSAVASGNLPGCYPACPGPGMTSIDSANLVILNGLDALATASTLAAAIPALALMLLFGGAYAATALAGRLQGQDHINEQIAAPGAAKVSDVIELGAMKTSTIGGGAITGGSGGSFIKYSASEQLAETRRSAETDVARASETFGIDTVNAIRQGIGMNHSFGQTVSSGVEQALGNDWSRIVALARREGFDLKLLASNGTQESSATTIRTELGGSIGGGGNVEGGSGTSSRSGTQDSNEVLSSKEWGRRESWGEKGGPSHGAGQSSRDVSKNGTTSSTSTEKRGGRTFRVGGSLDGGVTGANVTSVQDSESLGRDLGRFLQRVVSEDGALGRRLVQALSHNVQAAASSSGTQNDGFDISRGIKHAESDLLEKSRAFEQANSHEVRAGASQEFAENQIWGQLVSRLGSEEAARHFVTSMERTIRSNGNGGLGLADSYEATLGSMSRLGFDDGNGGSMDRRAAAVMRVLDGRGGELSNLDPSRRDELTQARMQYLNQVFDLNAASTQDASTANRGVGASLEIGAVADELAPQIVTTNVTEAGLQQQVAAARSRAQGATSAADDEIAGALPPPGSGLELSAPQADYQANSDRAVLDDWGRRFSAFADTDHVNANATAGAHQVFEGYHRAGRLVTAGGMVDMFNQLRANASMPAEQESRFNAMFNSHRESSPLRDPDQATIAAAYHVAIKNPGAYTAHIRDEAVAATGRLASRGDFSSVAGALVAAVAPATLRDQANPNAARSMFD